MRVCTGVWCLLVSVYDGHCVYDVCVGESIYDVCLGECMYVCVVSVSVIYILVSGCLYWWMLGLKNVRAIPVPPPTPYPIPYPTPGERERERARERERVFNQSPSPKYLLMVQNHRKKPTRSNLKRINMTIFIFIPNEQSQTSIIYEYKQLYTIQLHLSSTQHCYASSVRLKHVQKKTSFFGHLSG